MKAVTQIRLLIQISLKYKNIQMGIERLLIHLYTTKMRTSYQLYMWLTIKSVIHQ